MRKISFAVVGTLVVLVAIAGCGAGTSGSPLPSGASQVYTGQILFGSSVSADTMTVATPITTAKVGDVIGWVAYLNDAAKSTTLTVTVASVSSGGAEAEVDHATAQVSNPQFNQFAHVPDNSLSAYGAGKFTVRYIRPSDGAVLATGTITLTP